MSYRCVTAVALWASCRGEPPVEPPAVRAAAGSAIAPAPIDARPAPITVPGMRFDRPGQPLGFGTRWEAAGTDAMAFCPGDKELVAVSGTLVRWVSAEHGRVLREVAIDGAEGIDCGPNNAALTVADDLAVLIDRDGTIHRSPAGTHVDAARFAADGSVRVLANTSYAKWTGTALEPIAEAGSPAFLAEGGALVHVRDGNVLVRRDTKDKRIAHWKDGYDDPKPGIEDLAQVHVTDDGALVGLTGADGAIAYVDGKKQIISGTLGATAVWANKAWFVFAYGTQLWTQDRPGLDYAHKNYACGERRYLHVDMSTPLVGALSRDGKRIAIYCGDPLGIRVYEIESLKIVAGRDPLPIIAADWNGDQLATRDEDGTIELWRDRALVKSIDTGYDGRAMWWWGTDLAGDNGMGGGDMVRWSAATGKRGKKVPFDVELTARTREFPVHVTYPDGIGIQRGDKLDLLDYHGHKRIADLAVSPDGKRGLALRKHESNVVSSPEGMAADLVVLDLVTKATRILPLPADAVAASDRELAVGADRELSRLVDDKLVHVATTAAPITALAYSPDGRVLAVGGSDGTIAIYRGADLVATLRGHTGAIGWLNWDAPQLLSTAADQTLVWTFAE